MAKEFTEGQKYPAVQELRKPSKRRANRKEKDPETDDHRLQQRMKQIVYGENTVGYINYLRMLDTNPSLLKGCVPVKPSVSQKCSKRSWDGQIRKWRRALHMYDFVDFGDSEEQTQAVREALIEQNKNPLFTATPKRVLPDGHEVQLTPHPTPNPDVRLPAGFELRSAARVRYSADHLLDLANSDMVAPFIELPDSLYWLDKRVDLEDDIAEMAEVPGAPEEWLSPYTPGPSCTSSPNKDDEESPFYLTGTPVKLFAEAPGYTSPTVSVGHADDSPIDHIDALASFGDALLDDLEKETPWFPLEDYMPVQSPSTGLGQSSSSSGCFKPTQESPLFPSGDNSGDGCPLKEAISYFTAPECGE